MLTIGTALGIDGDEVSKSNFPLPNLSARLQFFATSLHKGRGFFLIKGLELFQFSVEDGVIIYLGIASHVGEQRGVQDSKGNVLSMEFH